MMTMLDGSQLPLFGAPKKTANSDDKARSAALDSACSAARRVVLSDKFEPYFVAEEAAYMAAYESALRANFDAAYKVSLQEATLFAEHSRYKYKESQDYGPWYLTAMIAFEENGNYRYDQPYDLAVCEKAYREKLDSHTRYEGAYKMALFEAEKALKSEFPDFANDSTARAAVTKAELSAVVGRANTAFDHAIHDVRQKSARAAADAVVGKPEYYGGEVCNQDSVFSEWLSKKRLKIRPTQEAGDEK